LVFSPELIGPLLRNHLTIRQNMPFVQGENFRMIGQFLSFDIFLAILALIGIAHIYDRPQDPLWLVFIWALSSGMWLMLRAMPRGSEAAVLLAPVALLAGQGGLVVGQQFKALWGQNRETGRSTRPGFLVMGVLGFIFFLGFSWQQFDGYNLREIDTAGDLNQYQQRPAIAAFVREHSAPDDCVLIDDPTMAVAADRLPTPNLVGLTPERVLGGLISEAEIIDLTQQANCKLVLFYRRDYHRHLMAFQAWAEDNFPNEHSSFENTKIYFK
jgi:hypothetical protein